MDAPAADPHRSRTNKRKRAAPVKRVTVYVITQEGRKAGKCAGWGCMDPMEQICVMGSYNTNGRPKEWFVKHLTNNVKQCRRDAKKGPETGMTATADAQEEMIENIDELLEEAVDLGNFKRKLVAPRKYNDH
jgi:hypothetical protein